MPGFDLAQFRKSVYAPLPGEEDKAEGKVSHSDIARSVYAPLPEPPKAAPPAPRPITPPEELAENQGTIGQIGAAFRKAYENGELSGSARAAVEGMLFNFADEFAESMGLPEEAEKLRAAPKEYPIMHGAGSMVPATVAGVGAAMAAPAVGAGIGAGAVLGGLQGLVSGIGAQPSGQKSFWDALDEGALGFLGGGTGAVAGKALNAAGGALVRGGKQLYNKVFPGPAPAPRPPPTMHIEPVDPLEELIRRRGMNPEEMTGGMAMPPGGLKGQGPRTLTTEMVPEPAPDPIMRGRGQYEIAPRQPEPDFLGMDVRRATPTREVPVEGPMQRGQGGRFMPRQLREVGGERFVPPYEGPLSPPPPPTPPSMVPGPVSATRGPQGPVSPVELPPASAPVYGMREVPPPLPVPPVPRPKAPPPRDLPSLGSIGQDLYRGRFIPAAGKAVEHLGAFAERMRTPSAPETLAPQASLLGRAAQLAPGKAAWELGAPYVTGQTVYAQEGGQKEPETAYAGRAAMNYAVQAALTRGASLGLSQADEAALTKAVVEGNDRAISAADFRLRQQYPAYAREVERELREMNDEP